MKTYEIIPHPSDVGIIAYGKTLKKTFENAASGMLSLIVDLKGVRSKTSFDITVEAQNQEELLVNWLNELLFLEDSQHLLFKSFKIFSLSKTELKAEVKGEKIDPKKHQILRSVKAATYNQLGIKETEKGWQVRVVFDV
ncbi:MAG: archease [Candidatus Saganbacteria bacterium]|nr:archease [Candidatus Saganbacteria bacterium]